MEKIVAFTVLAVTFAAAWLLDNGAIFFGGVIITFLVFRYGHLAYTTRQTKPGKVVQGTKTKVLSDWEPDIDYRLPELYNTHVSMYQEIHHLTYEQAHTRAVREIAKLYGKQPQDIEMIVATPRKQQRKRSL